MALSQSPRGLAALLATTGLLATALTAAAQDTPSLEGETVE